MFGRVSGVNELQKHAGDNIATAVVVRPVQVNEITRRWTASIRRSDRTAHLAKKCHAAARRDAWTPLEHTTEAFIVGVTPPLSETQHCLHSLYRDRSATPLLSRSL